VRVPDGWVSVVVNVLVTVALLAACAWVFVGGATSDLGDCYGPPASRPWGC
jgi:hypothetical protein